MKALITGAEGQLGSDLVELLGPDAYGFSHRELDITDPDALDRVFRLRPDIVFNCAAFHNVDVCEQQPGRAWEVNVEAVGELARRSRRLVHISTNYVFDGRREAPYGERDHASPRSVYARTKLAGEYEALGWCDRALVVRTAGLYGLHGSESKGGNFVQRMIARAREQGQLRVVSDQLVQPTFTADLAAAILEAVDSRVNGVVHLTSSGACSWHRFTQVIMARAGLVVPIEPVATVTAPGGAERPLNGVLARPRADLLGLMRLRSWQDALTDYMQRAHLTAQVPAMEVR
jgi:dTDP-4-dehydrorhamnose reductase